MSGSTLHLGSQCFLVVDRLDHRGHGEARVAGDRRPVRMPASAPGDSGRVEIVHTSPHRLVGRWLDRVPGSSHYEDPCPHRPACGGCVSWEVAPDALWAEKWRYTKERLGPLGDKLNAGSGPSPRGRWRTRHRVFVRRDQARIQFVVPTREKEVSLEIDDCPIVPEPLQKRLQRLRNQLQAPALKSVTSIVLTLGSSQLPGLAPAGIGLRAKEPLPDDRPPVGQEGDAVSWLEANDSSRSHFGGLKAPVSYSGPECVGVMVGGTVLPTPPFAFVQVHPEGRRSLLNKVLEYVPSEPSWALDAGCGTGLFARSLVKRGWRVIAVDAGPGLLPAWQRLPQGIDFYAEDAGTYRWPSDPPLVICDPPRAGMGKEWRDRLLAAKPRRAVLIHCGLKAAQRELHLLSENGYRCLAIEPIDLMPGTMQVELVSAWERIDEEDCSLDGRR